MKFEGRTHLPPKRYNRITNIRDEYGEIPFRMAISHLVSKGYEFFDKLTEEKIQANYEQLLKEEKSDAKGKKNIPVMTPEFIKHLNLCALALSKIEHITLLKYITNYVFYDIWEKQ